MHSSLTHFCTVKLIIIIIIIKTPHEIDLYTVSCIYTDTKMYSCVMIMYITHYTFCKLTHCARMRFLYYHVEDYS